MSNDPPPTAFTGAPTAFTGAAPAGAPDKALRNSRRFVPACSLSIVL
jgi:hypothetical protein